MNGQRWSIADARRTWSIANWGEGYFDVADDGALTVRPRREDGPAISLPDVVAAAQAQGSRLPLLVRFSDILRDRRARLQAAFAKAMREWDYPGGYTAIYPIKVNQQKGVAGELAASGGEGFGLEAGSKPELMAVLALARPRQRRHLQRLQGSRVRAPGADRPQARTRDLRRDREAVRARARASTKRALLGVEPLLGVRMRLASLGAGKWQNTGGDKGKFGLTPRQLLDLLDQLKAAKLSHALKLLHFHMGSQMSNVRDIAGGMREAVRYVVELAKSRRRHRLRRRRRRPWRRLRRHALALGLLDQLQPRAVRGDRSCSRSPRPSRSTASSRRAC